MGIQDLQPIFFGMLEETVAVNVVHEHDAHHRGQIRETPIAFDTLLQYHEQQIGYQCDPNLNFDYCCPVKV